MSKRRFKIVMVWLSFTLLFTQKSAAQSEHEVSKPQKVYVMTSYYEVERPQVAIYTTEFVELATLVEYSPPKNFMCSYSEPPRESYIDVEVEEEPVQQEPEQIVEVSKPVEEYHAKSCPDTIEEINQVIDGLSELEIMSRIIWGEQGSDDEAPRILVGLTILNRAKASNINVREVAKSVYMANGPHHHYNCIDKGLFWQDIPESAVIAAMKAQEIFNLGTYLVDNVECINVCAFKSAKNSEDLEESWYAWSRAVILYNEAVKRYTAFYE